MKYIYILFCVLNIVSCNTRNEYKESALNVYEQIINLNCNLDSLEFNILKRGSLYIFSNRDQSVFMKLDEDKVYIAEVRFVLEEFLLDSVCNSNKIDFCNLNKLDFIKLSEIVKCIKDLRVRGISYNNKAENLIITYEVNDKLSVYYTSNPIENELKNDDCFKIDKNYYYKIFK